LNFGSYDYGAEAVDAAAVEESVAADEADAANRPSNDDQDDGKSQAILPGDTANTNDRTNDALDAYCWEASSNSKAGWATIANGEWKLCRGEGSSCEVKVVRKSSDDSIVQIVSKCANEESCVANMKQNFNPGLVANSKYAWYVQQQCKPFGNAVLGPRFKSNNEKSTCVFCVEPCSANDKNSFDGSQACVGPSADTVADGTPALNDGSTDIDIFNQATLNSIPGGSNPFTTDNYYVTVTGTITQGGVTEPITVSRIQALQLNAKAGVTVTIG